MKDNLIDIRCNNYHEECRIEKSCQMVREQNQNLELQLIVMDTVVLSNSNEILNRKLPLILPDEMMYVPGSNFNDQLGDFSCYLPIFKHKLEKDGMNQTWIFGNLFMSQYYTVFNLMANYNEEDENI